MRRIVCISFVLALLIAPAAMASNQQNHTVSNGSFALTVDNNVTVHKGAPNLQFNATTGNTTVSDATCYIFVRELNYTTESFAVLAGKSATTGFGAPFPGTKLTSLTYDLYCNGSLQVTAASKVVMTNHIG